jgi:ElaB/YqjD/DUF883 family membrane-anchored ribosome-binding protein
MEVGMGDRTMDEAEHGWRSDAAASEHDQEGEGMDLTELSNRALELASRVGEWVVANPFAALGIAVGTGFLIGRTMRMWALRP